MIFPAICLISNRDLVSIPKTIERRLALAVTKSKASLSSLSNVIMASAVVPVLPVDEDFIDKSRWLKRSRLGTVSRYYLQIMARYVYLSLNTTKFSSRVHGLWSLANVSLVFVSAFADCLKIVAYSRTPGSLRVFHMSFIWRSRSISSL